MATNDAEKGPAFNPERIGETMTEHFQPELGSGALREALERRIIASLTQYIHQERVRLSGVYSKAFGAKDVKPEEVAKYENQTTATLANAIELIKIEFRDAEHAQWHEQNGVTEPQPSSEIRAKMMASFDKVIPSFEMRVQIVSCILRALKS